MDEGPPATDVYYARLYSGGVVDFLEMKPTKYGGRALVSFNPGVFEEPSGKISFKPVQVIDADPELSKVAKKLLKLGLIEKVPRNVSHPGDEKTYEYKMDAVEISKKYPQVFPTPEDVPKKIELYSVHSESTLAGTNTLKVDHTNKVIDLDINYRDVNPRRSDPHKDRNRGQSYVIPSGEVSFKGKENDLKKLVKFLLDVDGRITSDYRIVGDEKYRTYTLEKLLKRPDEVSASITGKFPVVLFHGTSTKRWETIKKRGLIPGSGGEVYYDLVTGYSENNIYLTFSHENAQNYATRQAIKDVSDAAVLRVTIPDYTDLVADEDVFGTFSPSRPYKISIMRKSWSQPETYTIEGSQPLKHILDSFGEGDIQDDEESRALREEIKKYMQTSLYKKSLKQGVIAYKGMIPPKFIELDMTYKRQKFKTPEQKGGPGEEEYAQIRGDVLKKAKRYDESLIRSLVKKIISSKI